MRPLDYDSAHQALAASMGRGQKSKGLDPGFSAKKATCGQNREPRSPATPGSQGHLPPGQQGFLHGFGKFKGKNEDLKCHDPL